MASGSSRPLSCFPGSNPEGSTPFGNHKLPPPPTPPVSRKGLYARGDSKKEGPGTEIGKRVASYDLSKNTTRHGSQNSPTASFDLPVERPSRDGASLYRSDSAHNGNSTRSHNLRTEQQTRTSPRVSYHECMAFDQAGSAILGCDNTRERNLVAIKRLNIGIDKRLIRSIQPFTSDYVVNVRDSYFHDDDLVIIYEHMDISLRDVTSILQAPFKPSQIAVICKQLVLGLLHIHEELSLYHGELSCHTILLNRDGMVKIANIGKSFAGQKNITARSRRDDICSLGSVMMELMEPTTYILSPQSTELQRPEKWQDGSSIKDFLSATQYQTLEQLKSHDFLPQEPLPKCFRAHVFCARIAAGTHWDILSLP